MRSLELRTRRAVRASGPLRPVVLFMAFSLALVGAPGCKKKDGGTSKSEAVGWDTLPKGTLGDAKTVEAVLTDPNLTTGGVAGTRVKLHGYAFRVSPQKVSISDAPDRSIPFVFCIMDRVPDGMPASRPHVVVEGTFDDSGTLTNCTIAPL